MRTDTGIIGHIDGSNGPSIAGHTVPTAHDLLEKKHAAERELLDLHGQLVKERQSCEKRITEIDEELKISGWVKPRKARQKK